MVNTLCIWRDWHNGLDFLILHPKQLGPYLGKGIIDPRIFGRDSTLPAEIKQIAIAPI